MLVSHFPSFPQNIVLDGFLQTSDSLSKKLNYSEGPIASYLEAQKIHLTMQSQEGVAKIFNNIGAIYGEQGNFPSAIENLNEGLTLFHGNEEGLKK